MASRGTLEVWSGGSLRWLEERVRRGGSDEYGVAFSDGSQGAAVGARCSAFSFACVVDGVGARSH